MRLTFPNGEHAAVHLEQGQIGVGSAAGGGTAVVIPGLAPLHAVFVSGRRGFWLTATDGARVVLNARPVRRLAWLRPGDLVCLGTTQVRVESDAPPAPARERASSPDWPSRHVLRGLNGSWFGRCQALAGGPLLLGSGAACDLRLEAVGVLDRHAQLEGVDGRWVLRALSGEASLRINGHVVSTAVLTAGDQIELGEQRLLLEAPGGLSPARATLAPETTPAVAEAVANANAKAPRDPGGLYLLIAAAAALAAALTAFFVYAPRG